MRLPECCTFQMGLVQIGFLEMDFVEKSSFQMCSEEFRLFQMSLREVASC